MLVTLVTNEKLKVNDGDLLIAESLLRQSVESSDLQHCLQMF